jgi:hypothetical protein
MHGHEGEPLSARKRAPLERRLVTAIEARDRIRAKIEKIGATIEREGDTITGSQGQQVGHPLHRVAVQLEAQLDRLNGTVEAIETKLAELPAGAGTADAHEGWRSMDRADWEALPEDEARKLYREQVAPALAPLWKAESLRKIKKKSADGVDESIDDVTPYLATLPESVRAAILDGSLALAQLAVPAELALGRNPRDSGSAEGTPDALTVRLADLTWVERSYRPDQSAGQDVPRGRFLRGEKEARRAARAPASGREAHDLRKLGLRVYKVRLVGKTAAKGGPSTRKKTKPRSFSSIPNPRKSS